MYILNNLWKGSRFLSGLCRHSGQYPHQMQEESFSMTPFRPVLLELILPERENNLALKVI